MASVAAHAMPARTREVAAISEANPSQARHGSTKTAKQSDNPGIPATVKAQYMDNYDLETSERTRMLEQSLANALAQLKRTLQARCDSVAQPWARILTAGEYVTKFGADPQRAAQAVAARESQSARVAVLDHVEELMTAKKRKRVPTDGTAVSQETEASPTKPAKFQRTLQLGRTPSRQPQSSTLPNATASRPGPPGSTNAGRVPSGRHTASSKRISTVTASASNFVYRARPSIQFNARLPQTPQVKSNSVFGNQNTVKKVSTTTARRVPRRNESIQAYSMNGSPLGILDLAVESDDGTSNGEAATTPALDVPPEEADEEWDMLHSYVHHDTGSVPARHESPNKRLLRKGSASSISSAASKHSATSAGGAVSTTSAFKTAILAGASRVSGAVSSRSTSSQAPSQDQFTFAPAGLPQHDHEAWLSGLRKDMETMTMSENDKRMLERRMMEVLRGAGK